MDAAIPVVSEARNDMDLGLHGKKAIVCAASKGLGKACAISLAREGVELVITLGTGLGSAIFTEGVLCPGLELGHHPWRRRTYEDYLGKRGLEKLGVKRWNKLLKRAIKQTSLTFNWDTLYIGGGNSKKVKLKLGKEVKLISNEEGLLGAMALWRDPR